MSKGDLDSDGFQTVKSKYSAKNKHTKLPNRDLQFVKQEIDIDFEQTKRRITSAIEDLRNSQYLKEAIKAVSTILQSKSILEIVCFGLGQISSCNISRYQLAFLLCLKEYFKPQKVLAHDPIFYKSECDLLEHFSVEIIERNNEGVHAICNTGVTLVFFPHCPKQLTNNFLWSNWNANLKNCIIICNSFSTLIENNPSRILKESVPYIHKLYPYTLETILENIFRYTDVFNDTSIHIFPEEKINSLPLEFWNKCEKPSYKNTEEFITNLMVEKLNISSV